MNETQLLIGNIISLIGSVLMVLVGILKTKKAMLHTQNAQFALMVASNLVLGSVPASLSNGLGIVRNLLSFKWDLSLAVRLGFIALQAVITAFVNQLGIIGWMPVLAAGAFTLSISSKDEILLKAAAIFGALCWCVHDLTIRSYTSFVFNIATIISGAAGILLVRKARKTAQLAK